MLSDQSREIRDMTAEDLEEIMAIEVHSFSSPWTRGMFIEELHSTISRNLVFKLQGRVAGYLTFWFVLDEVHIIHIAVQKDCRRGGVASLLMEEMIARARRNGVINATLEVRRSNEGAIKFYERFGFVITGMRPHYYTETPEDALIMWAKIVPKETKYEWNSRIPAGEDHQQP